MVVMVTVMITLMTVSAMIRVLVMVPSRLYTGYLDFHREWGLWDVWELEWMREVVVVAAAKVAAPVMVVGPMMARRVRSILE